MARNDYMIEVTIIFQTFSNNYSSHESQHVYNNVLYLLVSHSSGAFSQQAKTQRTGNEIVVQDTDAYARHIARYTAEMGERPTAQAFDKSLSDQNSDIFMKKQKWLAEKQELESELEEDAKSSKNMIILIGIVFFGAVIAMFIRQSNEKRYEKMLRENKAKKSK